jgi:hypothetical protein
MENKINILVLSSILLLFIFINFISALIIDAEYITTYPGEQENIKIKIENNLNYDVEDISLFLNLEDTPFTIIGSSEKNLEELDEGDDERLIFTLKSSTDIIPGDYNLYYTLRYINAENSNSSQEERTGSFGIRVSAKTDIDFSIETKEAIVGKTGEVSLKIINKGLGKIKFVSVQIFPEGFELISSDKIYIGNIDSDDSDFANFDVIFKSSSPNLNAKVDYKNFDNEESSEVVNIPIKVYTQEEALRLGLINKNNTGFYIGIVILILIIWFIYRKIRKIRKKNKGR